MGSNNQPRSFRFYRKNEEEVMESLGMKPTKNSGSGWVEKEDGQNDFLICQLKSTDAQSIRINQKDIRMLEYNAHTTHKLPVFAIQFLNTGEVWLMSKPEDFIDVAQYISTGSTNQSRNEFLGLADNLIDEKEKNETEATRRPRIISSGSNSREQFYKKRQDKFRKENSAWK